MKTIIYIIGFVFLCFAVHNNGFSQGEYEDFPVKEPEFISNVWTNQMRFSQELLRVYNSELEDAVIEYGKILMEFLIEEDGEVSEINIRKPVKGDSDLILSLDKIDIQFPEFKPAKDELGNPIKARIKIPLRICFR